MLYYLYRLIAIIVSWMPYSLVLLLGRVFGWLYYALVKKQVNLAKANISSCLGVSAEKADEITRAMCRNIGMTFMEIVYMPALNAGNARQFVKFEREDILQAALAEKKGVVLLGIHMDNWEWLGAALTICGYPLTTFAKKQPSESVNRILSYLRRRVGIEVYARGTNETITAARSMKKGKMLGFIADQDGGYDGIFVPFLGRMASTPVGPAFFARKFQAPIVPLFIVRDPAGGHRAIVYDKFYYEDTGDEQKDMYDCTNKMTQIVEAVIRQYPDNWLWFQHRWNTPYKGQAKDEPGSV